MVDLRRHPVSGLVRPVFERTHFYFSRGPLSWRADHMETNLSWRTKGEDVSKNFSSNLYAAVPPELMLAVRVYVGIQ